jgi:GWxTD domain-containing protein
MPNARIRDFLAAFALLTVPCDGHARLDATPAGVPDSSGTAGSVMVVRPLRLAPQAGAPALEGAGWRAGRIFARIDSLSALFDDPTRPDRGALAHRIGQLYLATDMFKHRRTALDYLDQAIALDPGRFEAFRLRAATAERMQYPGQAAEWYETTTQTFPHESRGHVALGRFRLLEARKLVDREGLVRSREAFQQAVAADSSAVEAWLGWAACSLVLGEFESTLAAGQHLSADSTLAGTGWLLTGAAYMGLQQDEAAATAFERGVELLDAGTSAIFLKGEEFVMQDALRGGYAAAADSSVLESVMRRHDEDWTWEDGVDLKRAGKDAAVRQAAVEAWWRDRNPWPTHVANRHLLTFWKRLVEADVLFGDPETGDRGWDTEPGLAWVRWGPPTDTRYEAAGWGNLLDALEDTPLREENLQSGVAYWIWSYRLPAGSFGLVFRDITYHKRWMTTKNSRLSLLAIGKQAPLLSDHQERREPSFTVAFSTAAFPRSAASTTVETYVSFQPLPMPALSAEAAANAARAVAALGIDSTDVALVELAIFDADYRRVDYVRHPLHRGRRQGSLLRELGDQSADPQAGPLLLQVGAQLAAGEYEIALDVSDARDGAHRALRAKLLVEPATTGRLEVSELEFASSFTPYQAGQVVPTEFVKHAFTVLPVPDGVVAADAGNVFVYYEVYNLATDARGHTRFNVTYEVFRDRQRDRDEQPLAQFRRDGADRIDPLTMTFVEETSAVSQQRHVVKGAAVDIAALPPGRYVLVVTVEDLLSGERCNRYRPFRKAKSTPPGAAAAAR